MAAKKTKTTRAGKPWRTTSDEFIAQTSRGELRLPLDIPVRAFRRFKALTRSDDIDDLDAFLALLDFLDEVEDKDYGTHVSNIGIIEIAQLVDPYFQAFAKTIDERVNAGE